MTSKADTAGARGESGPKSRQDTVRALRMLGGIGIAIAALVMAIKYVAYVITGSVALYSDALESIVNVMTAMAALLAIEIGSRPADRHHQFGHHKAEFFAAIFEGVMIVLAALAIMHQAYISFLVPEPIDQPVLGLMVNGAAGVLNALWAWFLIRRARTLKSAALEAEGAHVVTDVITSAGVVVGVAVAALTGWQVLDALIAAAVGFNILWIGYRIALASMSSLMDEAATPEVQAHIRQSIRANGYGALQAHDIRTRQAGRALFIEFHLVVPGSMTVDEAHVICDRLEEGIERDILGSEVVIHVEPEAKAKDEAIEL